MILLFALFAMNANGQKDISKADSARQADPDRPKLVEGSFRVAPPEPVKHKSTTDLSEHSPTRAMAYSMILPGLGQAFNKNYFKIPFIYVAFGGVGYWLYYNNQGYKQASANYSADPNSTNERYLRAWRRNLEISYITTVGVYALQVLDAYVDANLYFWDVGQELGLKLGPSIEPMLSPGGYAVINYGFKCKLSF